MRSLFFCVAILGCCIDSPDIVLSQSTIIFHSHALLPGTSFYSREHPNDPYNIDTSWPSAYEVSVDDTISLMLSDTIDVLAKNSLVRRSADVRFVIDSASSLIRNLHISDTVRDDNGGPHDTMFSIVVDSASFVRFQDSTILVRSEAFYSSYSLSSYAYTQYSGGGVITTGASGSGVAIDTIYLWIFPPGTDAVPAVSAPQQSYLRISYLPSVVAKVSFGPVEQSRWLAIVDYLGRTTERVFVRANQTEVEIGSLPPGLYFARLGDQVAKFVVPPR